jgi:hypothetical protein
MARGSVSLLVETTVYVPSASGVISVVVVDVRLAPSRETVYVYFRYPPG